VLKEADEVVGALSALFGGGSQGLNLGNMTFANPGMAGMLSGMSSLSQLERSHMISFCGLKNGFGTCLASKRSTAGAVGVPQQKI